MEIQGGNKSGSNLRFSKALVSLDVNIEIPVLCRSKDAGRNARSHKGDPKHGQELFVFAAQKQW